MRVAVTAIFITAANASIKQMMKEIESGFNRAVLSDRNLGLILGPGLAQIDNYGCWCFFQENHGSGKGSPLDEADRICKALHHGYDCAILDVLDASGDECIPWEVDYNAGTSFGIDGIKDSCETLNPDSLCAQFACMVEGVFVVKMIQTFITFGAINPANLPQNGFDFRSSCIVDGGTDNKTDDRECCGLLPFRYPYKPIDRECCGPATFDPSLQDCCADNIPRFSCV